MVLYNLDNAESRQLVENCYRTSKVLINPLIDWDDEFLWWYIRNEKIEINPLYGCGNTRCGCIGCPMAGKERYAQFAKYPKYELAYKNSFARMLEVRKRKGLPIRQEWKNAQSVFEWWMEDENIDGQYSMNFDGENLIGYNEKGK